MKCHAPGSPGCVASGFSVATYQSLISLLVISGIRIGEAIGLDEQDLDLDAGLLMVRHLSLFFAIKLHHWCHVLSWDNLSISLVCSNATVKAVL